MRRYLLLFVFVITCAPQPACTSVCDQIEANVPAVNARLADVQRAISEVEKAGIRDQIPEDKREVFDEAMAKVKDGYALAVQANALASEACADSRNYLDMIVQGWDVVRTFLALVGGEGSPPIADPIVYVEARGG